MVVTITKNNKIYSNGSIKSSIKYYICTFYASLLVIFGFIMDTAKNIFFGLLNIVTQPDILITDYIEVGGLGGAFVNSGILTLITILIFRILKIDISGPGISTLWLTSGFSLFGKNIFNIWFIILGVYLYSKSQRESFNKYVYTAMLGTCLSPLVTQFTFNLGTVNIKSIILGAIVGVLTGFLLPPLSSYLLKIHRGYNLYNTGFAAGIIGMVFASIIKSYGFALETRLIWTKGNNSILFPFLLFMFLSMVVLGFCLNDFSFKGYTNLFRYSGKLSTDFVELVGFPVVLINMGINGILASLFVILVNGDLNGPTLGGIFTIVGFSAFGKHLKNMFPVILGVYIGSLTKIWYINDPSVILAALFCTTLAPIAGEYGFIAGTIAGFLHSSVVLNVTFLHQGFNLYNNGFSGGFVAIILIPIIESLRNTRLKKDVNSNKMED
ncbi:membrane protein [Fervidicella metallireducens AeB]|uniref:Membrane protein n=1 Tax=Fervidicella metallireducens AeB TaxID=1403537 RepID=A0A017RSZ7_9CLOT|nr:DUF1576 domain-containing protein [Fervidicella metallireducens]EYE87736.1 membrane protein [Fervidicella metallireducens AeB]